MTILGVGAETFVKRSATPENSEGLDSGTDDLTISSTALAAVSVVVAILALLSTLSLSRFCRKWRLGINTNRADIDSVEPSRFDVENVDLNPLCETERTQHHYHNENGDIKIQINYNNTVNNILVYLSVEHKCSPASLDSRPRRIV